MAVRLMSLSTVARTSSGLDMISGLILSVDAYLKTSQLSSQTGKAAKSLWLTLLRNRCLVANALEVSELMVECVAMATSYAQRHPNVECAYGVLHLLSRGQLQEAVDMFYHGYDNYMQIAFPEDELRPVTCVPLTRDREHPENIGLNDVLGNYSVTLIDTLSTLAVLGSSAPSTSHGKSGFQEFQRGVQLLVETYGDGSEGPAGYGVRGRGFDVDSKVQVFETVIRGVGGLLSAHLFAVGDLPIRGYGSYAEGRLSRLNEPHSMTDTSINWSNGFTYDGQLLRLALDLGKRLLPAFSSATGIPYPRVNLRHGIPFYLNSPLHADAEHGECGLVQARTPEITETCSAGAGSLVLEFTTLSRLTGDNTFERLAKRAFWEIWDRRSPIGLIGAGIDAESGLWTSAITGVGAGIDSFFEYALKSHILLSGLEFTESIIVHNPPNATTFPLSEEKRTDDADAFLEVWQTAHTAIKRHLYRDLHHPHYVNSHFRSGAPLAPWIDSLSAYYPGLLSLGGELDEAIETNLLYTALWTRYSALPERWSILDGGVEGGLGWWPGRPELIESTYYLYRATKDPWYLHVGEMILKDIKRRCWTECGWAGLQDVRTGELTDRMESFFLGETIKYLFLLFDADHPLNRLDAPFVMSTEGHPLIIRRRPFPSGLRQRKRSGAVNKATCPAPPASIPLTVSATAARGDIYHAASLARLHLTSSVSAFDQSIKPEASIPLSLSDLVSADNAPFPWTLPWTLIPPNGTCSKLKTKSSFEIQFPNPQSNIYLGQQTVSHISEGLLVHSLGGLKMGMVLDELTYLEDGQLGSEELLRVHSIGNLPLGRDEKVFIDRDALKNLADPNFSKVQDVTAIDLLIEAETGQGKVRNQTGRFQDSRDPVYYTQSDIHTDSQPLKFVGGLAIDQRGIVNMASQREPQQTVQVNSPVSEARRENFHRITAFTATGIGASPLPDIGDAAVLTSLPWRAIYIADTNCNGKLPDIAATLHQVIVIRRGGCSFSIKLANVPSFRPSKGSLQLVVVVSDGDDDIRPMLDEIQYTPGGLVRYHQIAMVMVGGGQETYELLAKAKGIGLRKKYHVQSQGIVINNLIVL